MYLNSLFCLSQLYSLLFRQKQIKSVNLNPNKSQFFHFSEMISRRLQGLASRSASSLRPLSSTQSNFWRKKKFNSFRNENVFELIDNGRNGSRQARIKIIFYSLLFYIIYLTIFDHYQWKAPAISSHGLENIQNFEKFEKKLENLPK